MKYILEISDKSSKSLKQIEDLHSSCNIDERIDYDCEFLLAKDKDDQLVGLAGVSLKKDKYPQFEHIWIHPKYQNSKLLIIVMNYMENFLRKNGKIEYVSYILNSKNNMQAYALHWKMIPYSSDEKGVWFAKGL